MAAQRERILSQRQPQDGSGAGELSLRGWIGKLGGVNDRGNVYVGEFPVKRCEMSNTVAVAFNWHNSRIHKYWTSSKKTFPEMSVTFM